MVIRVLPLLLVAVLCASAAEYTFTGQAGTDWNAGANWNLQKPPGTGDDVIIPAGAAAQLSNTTPALGKVTVGGKLTIARTRTIGTLTAANLVNNGIVEVGGALVGVTVSGSPLALLHGAQLTNVTFASPQTVSGATNPVILILGSLTLATDVEFRIGEQNNSGGVQLVGDQQNSLAQIIANGPAKVTFGASPSNQIFASIGTRIRIGPQVTISGSTGFIFPYVPVSNLPVKQGALAIASPDPDFLNEGTIDSNVSRGLITVGAPDAAIVNQGVMSASGGVLAVSGSLRNEGIFSPGPLNGGNISLVQDFTQIPGATLMIAIGGEAPGTFDQLVIEGNLILDGTVDVELVNKFEPKAGSTYDIVRVLGGTIDPILPTLSGSASASFTIESLSDSVRLTVPTPPNLPPVIVQAPEFAVTIDEDSSWPDVPITLSATDPEGDPLTWTISNPVHGRTVPPVTRLPNMAEFPYAPESDFYGEERLTATVFDDHGGSATCSIVITINPINDPPQCTANPQVSGALRPGATLTAVIGTWNDDRDRNTGPLIPSYQWIRADAEGQNPVNIPGAISSNYLLTTADAGRTIAVEVTQTDRGIGQPPSTSTTVRSPFSTIASIPNSPPVISGFVPNANGEKNLAIVMDQDATPRSFPQTVLIATDPEQDVLSWFADDALAEGVATITQVGNSATVSYVPPAGFFGIDTFTVTVRDGRGGADTLLVSVTVEQRKANTPPVITGFTPDRTGAKILSVSIDQDGDPVAFPATLVSASDGDNDPLSWSLDQESTRGSAGLAPDGNTATISYTPRPGYVGTDEFFLSVRDSRGGTDSLLVRVEVRARIPQVVTAAFVTTTFEIAEGMVYPATDPSAQLVIRLSGPATTDTSFTIGVDSQYAGDLDLPASITIPTGQTTASVTLHAVEDGPDGYEDENVTLSLISTTQSVTVNGGNATVKIIDAEPLSALLKPVVGEPVILSLNSPSEVASFVGQACEITIANGIPPFGIDRGAPAQDILCFETAQAFVDGAPGTTGRAPAKTYRFLARTPVTAREIRVHDAKGQGFTVTFTARQFAPHVVPLPRIDLSAGRQTRYVGIGPGTVEGLASLKQALASRTDFEARAFWWDTGIQDYREIGRDPEETLTIQHGIFLATRRDLGLRFDGVPAGFYSEVTLNPGYNLITIPPVTPNGSDLITEHPLDSFVLYRSGEQNPIVGETRSLLIDDDVQEWNGSSYVHVTTLASGHAYWINNTGTIDLTLIRFPDDAEQDVAVTPVPDTRPTGGNTGTLPLPTKPRGVLPPLPGASVTGADDHGGGSCGSGAGVILVGMALVLGFARRRRAA